MAAVPSTRTYELLGSFYLGRVYDLATSQLGDQMVLYDSRDLVTHAVIVGMTGSGKTGLGLSLIEEAAIDRVPVLAIDPKGDIGNLLLTFPNLAAADFRPWIDENEPARAGMTADTVAEREAERWKQGLAEWGQDGARIARLREAVEFAIYTPGSGAGIPVSILNSFAAPSPAEREDVERMAEAVTTTAAGVLTLLGIDADPVQSREHTLLSGILNEAWCKGEDLDLPGLIQRIQQPPFTRVGVLEVEAFYPEKDRFGLAMRLNGLLATPGFARWLDGEPLDVAGMLYTPEGKPRVAIVSIAHLADAERMFFVTLLLNQVVSWMRAQSGTSSLRALLYMDEVAGYVPPVAAPPSKQALLLLMKQARAFGLGVVLATQNPADIDYKGLANAGTWFLGRLQTERDKARLLGGLEGALSGQGRGFDREAIDRALSSLRKRTFYLHNVHDDGPLVFQTRWAMSYLRGPLTKDQIKRLQPPIDVSAADASGLRVAGTPATHATSAASQARSARQPRGAHAPPLLPPPIEQFFVPGEPGTSGLAYEPALFASASVRFVEPKRGVDLTRTVTRLVPFGSGAVVIDWAASEETDIAADDLETAPAGAATFGELPPAAAKQASYQAWLRDFGRWLQQEQILTLHFDEATGLASAPDESEAQFRARVALKDRETRDAAKEKLRLKFAPKLAMLDERIRRASQAVAREHEQASESKMQTGISLGTTILGALFGRKTMSASTIGRATTAARGVGRSMRQSQDVKRAEETREALQAQRTELDHDFEAAIAGLEAAAPAAGRPFSTIDIKPKKTHVTPERVVLVWCPA